jgi:hypothetical protein
MGLTESFISQIAPELRRQFQAADQQKHTNFVKPQEITPASILARCDTSQSLGPRCLARLSFVFASEWSVSSIPLALLHVWQEQQHIDGKPISRTSKLADPCDGSTL